MKKTNKLLIITIILFAVDFLLTLYFLNNSGATEGNPLIEVGQGYIILVINIIYFLIVFILERILTKYETVILDSTNTFDYIKKLHQSSHSKYIYISLIFSFVYASIFSRIITITDWIVFSFTHGNFYNTLYSKLRSLMPFERFDIILSIFSIFIFLPLWYWLEYKKSQRLLSQA